VGKILCRGPLEPVLLVHPKLGGEEDPAPLGESQPAPRLWMEAVEPGMAVRDVWAL
jgi:hypothetical protein